MFTFEEILETALEGFDLAGLNILLAGGGRNSARTIIDRQPYKMTCVCAPGDKTRVDRIFNELGGERKDAEVITANLGEPGYFKDNTFDLIIADYFISKIDFFAPRQHLDILKWFHGYLKPGGSIIVIDVEPDMPQVHEIESINGPMDSIIRKMPTATMELDNATRYRMYRRIRKLLVDLSINHAIAGFREIPGDWVEQWLSGVGFKSVSPQLATRILTIDLNREYENRVRSYVKIIDDEKAQKYVEALLDRTEALLMEVCPFDQEQDIYIITAEKR